MKKIKQYTIAITVLLFGGACAELDTTPQGILSEEQVQTPENIEGLVISAYSALGNDHYTAPHFFWPTGNLRAGDAHKGGDGSGDIFAYHALSVYQPLIADMSSFPPDRQDLNNKMWVRLYGAISRTNSALAVLNEMNETEYELLKTRQGEMRFLRGVFYFFLKIHYKRVPFIDETITTEQALKVSNVALTDQELWTKIADDFRFAKDNLPETQSEVGRANKYSAAAFLAKVLLYQAYEQDDQHAVIDIHEDKLEEVVSLVDEVIASGNYGLEDDFAKNFLYEFDNGKESIFAIQRSQEDGSPDGRGSWSTALNSPHGGTWGCCGFHVPTQNFVNAFKTDADGLPMFDTFNDSDLIPAVDAVDPRLDHTVAMDGKPWKYEAGYKYNAAWARAGAVYGTYASMKENERSNCACEIENGPFKVNSKNTVLIRYSDMLLWKAEALIELGRHAEALPIINEIRTRAKNSVTRLNNASTYRIDTYDGSVWTQQYAREALRWERRLELGLEGHRFFDLVRWGVAKETIDEYLAVEKTKRTYLTDAAFTKGKHEYMPIPETQVVLSGRLYVQNNSY
jgi:starch-binding outer membrane protein, SusD/RagB family